MNFQKVVRPQEMRDIEKEAFSKGVNERDLMENAGHGVARFSEQVIKQNHLQHRILILAGKGNNGGDGFVAGRYLLEKGFEVHAILLQANLSTLCLEQKKAFLQSGGKMVGLSELQDSISDYGLLLDGLFGTGFTGVLEGDLKKLVNLANHSSVPIIAIDIPSGLNGETGEILGPCIHAAVTLTLTAPKIGFYLNQGWNVVGNIEVIPIGLPEPYIEKMEASFLIFDSKELSTLLPPIVRNRHKYERGHAILLAGSKGMTGSAYLASMGAFRGGAGYVQLLIRDGMENAYHGIPELITKNSSNMTPDEILEFIHTADAVLMGPGFGRDEDSQHLLAQLIPHLEVKIVLDADALFLLSQKKIKVPKGALFTPHHGEMAKLLHLKKTPPLTMSFIEDCQAYAREHQIHLLLKGGPTFYISPTDEPPIVITAGDPGMATAGSGDLLSGILVSLLSQGLEPNEAAILGASLHGLAGQFAAQETTSYCMKASDIADHLPQAYKFLLS